MSKIIVKEQIRPICILCGTNPSKIGVLSKNGFRTYLKHCSSCNQKVYNTIKGKRRVGYQLTKKDVCETCGFTPEHPCQLDVDHIDGDKTNNNLGNLQTLCANCHRLKTHNDRNKKT